MTDILNMAFYTALEIRENEYDYLIIAQSNHPHRCCPHCQSLDYNKHGMREPIFMDTPIHGKRVGIKIMRQRYRCKSCANVFIDRLIGMNEDHMMTNRLVHFIEEECLKRTFTSIAEDVGIDEKTQEIKQIMDDSRGQYNYFGVRSMTQNPVTSEQPVAVVGESIANSYNWYDGDSTGEKINGVCALAVDADDSIAKIEKVLARSKMYHGEQIVLLGSMYSEYGEDAGEVIMSGDYFNPVTVLAVI